MSSKFLSWKAAASAVAATGVLAGVAGSSGILKSPQLLASSRGTAQQNPKQIPVARSQAAQVKAAQPRAAVSLTPLRTLSTQGVSSLDFSADGRTLATGGKYPQLWDVATGRLKTTLDQEDFGGTVAGVAYSPTELLLATGHYDEDHEDGALKLWGGQTGQTTRVLQNPGSGNAGLDSVAFSPNGRLLASSQGTEDDTENAVKLWDVRTGKAIRTLASIGVGQLKFHSGGSLLAGATTDAVKLWDVRTGTVVRTFSHPGGVSSIAFSRNGGKLASASTDEDSSNGTVKLWNAATGQLLRTLRVEGYGVESVVFTSDGNTLLVGGGKDGNQDETGKTLEQPSGVVNLYSASTGALQSSVPLSTGPASMMLSPDGKVLALAQQDGPVRLFQLR